MKAITLLSTAALIAGGRSGLAQNLDWAEPVSGFWNVPANWSQAEIPDSLGEVARIAVPGVYSVDIERSVMLGGLEIPNPDATLNLLAGNSAFVAVASASVLLNGVLSINPTGENRITELAHCGQDLNLRGSGTLRLNAHPDNLDSARITTLCSVGYLITEPRQRIAGTGRVATAVSNYGVIEADIPGRVLELQGSFLPGFGNGGLLGARDGGILRVRGQISQVGSGAIVVEYSASRVEIEALIYGGVIRNSAGGTSEFRDFCGLNGTTLEGIHHLKPGVWLDSSPDGITNNGTLIVNDASARPKAQFGLWYSPYTVLEGSGTVLLNAPEDDLALAQLGLDGSGEGVTTIGSAQCLAGTGSVAARCINYGTLSPGGNNGPIGVIELREHEWTQAQSAALVIDVRGAQPQQYDRIIGDATIVLGGALVVRLANEFAPAVGDEFTILEGPAISGAFSRIDGPPVAGAVWHVFRRDWSLVLTLTCATDLNGDRETSLADLAILLAHFGETAADPADGDVDGNGRVDMQDLANLLAVFGGACG